MRGRGLSRAPPGRVGGSRIAAIHDQSFAPEAEFKAGRARMTVPRRRWTGIDKDETFAGAETFIPAVRRVSGRANANVRLRQRQIDQTRIAFDPAVEMRQLAVAMTKHPNHGRGVAQRRIQRCAHILGNVLILGYVLGCALQKMYCKTECILCCY